MRHGPENPSTAELLALCLVSGSQGEDAVRMSRRLLEEFGGISTSRGASVVDVEADFAKGERFNDQQSVSRYFRKRIGH